MADFLNTTGKLENWSIPRLAIEELLCSVVQVTNQDDKELDEGEHCDDEIVISNHISKNKRKQLLRFPQRWVAAATLQRGPFTRKFYKQTIYYSNKNKQIQIQTNKWIMVTTLSYTSPTLLNSMAIHSHIQISWQYPHKELGTFSFLKYIDKNQLHKSKTSPLKILLAHSNWAALSNISSQSCNPIIPLTLKYISGVPLDFKESLWFLFHAQNGRPSHSSNSFTCRKKLYLILEVINVLDRLKKEWVLDFLDIFSP